MKKIICLLLVLAPILLPAQSKFSSVKLGLFTPGATDAGFIIGYEGGWYVDDNFLIGYSADWFKKNYVDQKFISQINDLYGPNSTLNELRAKTNLHSVPIMGSVTGNWIVAQRTRAFVTGAAGLEVLLIFYRDYSNPSDDKFRGAFDFSWRLGFGLMYELGRRSDAIAEISYHYSKPSWQYDVRDSGTGIRHTFERSYDMSGIMMRAGFRFYF
ncbi:MAG: hypothetical protein CVV24_03565 [Ignavibacteriae bacterium HGW-Ignavibacteriae-3]|nr:MAG: hypothetical protein CVV24_03565 [Ignavibacteriae bacterium HGW-Ignavibacteriae-3]